MIDTITIILVLAFAISMFVYIICSLFLPWTINKHFRMLMVWSHRIAAILLTAMIMLSIYNIISK